MTKAQNVIRFIRFHLAAAVKLGREEDGKAAAKPNVDAVDAAVQ